ncbi:DUF5686 and carboxypeptidase regulatory-like domain-containing protein [Pedobacter immunditicola]|uniref:DUF5686 and carboxypeptidase regulatory-like domain-containing protein n=1 Tax=Pedobacter immunditicola TaxID=3133440 RepID=UPI0030ADC1B2
MKKIFFTLLFFLAIVRPAFSQQLLLTGNIKDQQGMTVPFTSVYIKNTTIGTSANIDGVYMLKLNKGAYTIVFKTIGYKTVEKVVELDSNAVENVVLTPETYSLKEVSISANAKDPAYEIIKNAIKNRKKHLEEVKEFSCNVYIKGVQKLVGAPKKFFGRDIQKTLDLDTNRKGILYQSESQSTYNCRKPNHVHEEMIASKVAGRNNAFSFNKASDLEINFYNNIILENVLSSRGFVSPIADYALFYYKYKLIGTTVENGVYINKIEVTPRRKHDPAFRGYIYIADDNWRIQGTDLYLTKNTGINLIDTLNIIQQFTKVDSTYMPSNINFTFNGNVMGFKFDGYYLGVFNNYNLNPNFPDSYFNGEILKIPKNVNQKDTTYWNASRPIPLNLEEKINYIRKDSIAKRKESKFYLDSLERVNNNFTTAKLLLTHYTINNRYAQHSVKLDPVLKAFIYNTVEGFGINYGFTFTKEFEYNRKYSIRPEIRYGFASRTLTANISGDYYYDPVKKAHVSLSMGSGIYDLNRYGTMNLLSNTLNTLLFEKNYPKFYQKNFINGATTREIARGLQGAVAIQYARNKNLVNNTTFSFFDRDDQEFTSNNPYTPLVETPLFPDYNALTTNLSLIYTFGQKYITRPDGKIYQESKAPRIELTYQKGFKNVLGSDVDYDLISMEVYKERISAGLWGYSSFVVGAGKFLNNNVVFYPESKHFRGNNSLTSLPDIRKFSFLDFYQYSTDRHYVEAHVEHNFAGLIMNKIPLIRKLKLEEVIGGSYLNQPLKKNYKEFYYGLQRLIFRVTYGYAYDGNRKVHEGFRISYGF